MNLVLIQADGMCPPDEGMLCHALKHPLLAAMIGLYHERTHAQVLYALPEPQISNTCLKGVLRPYCETDQVLTSWNPSTLKEPLWICISQGAYVDQVDEDAIATLLSKSTASVVCIGVDEQLAGHREQMRRTPDGCIVGFRRYYGDSLVAVPPFEKWPNRIYVRSSCLDCFASLPLAFDRFENLCRRHDLHIQSFAVAGLSHDLNTPKGQIGLVRLISDNKDHVRDILAAVPGYHCLSHEKRSGSMPRVIGKVWISRDAKVSPDAILISPAVVSDRVCVESRAVVESSIVGPEARVNANTMISHHVFGDNQDDCSYIMQRGEFWRAPAQESRFFQWSKWDYVNTVKRAFDIAVALAVLILFLPIFPVITLAIKINSPGPLFYRARRQGLYGKEFDCLKFRTMKVGADQLQDKLRAINEVDGPQFKMADDPRISAVGRFLRETYLDEIPQFINVLKGEMSVVGPRPSPKTENTQCPRWRDARLSVRPGVTGLWQLLRTREPLRDFQEWIHYDMDYVRRVSSRLDLWICWKTSLQMLGKFVGQF
jgi:lipopolysaccharide/colanic/teichoic acid biosynthesis glycosyltransferase